MYLFLIKLNISLKYQYYKKETKETIFFLNYSHAKFLIICFDKIKWNFVKMKIGTDKNILKNYFLRN